MSHGGWFCTNAPEILQKADGGAIEQVCGGSAKVPSGVESDGFEGQTANAVPWLTELVRKDEPDACCYAYRRGPCGKGRPMSHEGAFVLAREVEREGWSGHDSARIAGDVRAIASEAEIASLVAHLRRVAILEHASVAAFARVSLELLALGAPADLVKAAHVAALDEIRHAEQFWSLLEGLEGTARGPSPMPIPPFSADDRAQILVSTIVDGCVGELASSLVFHEAARVCRVPSLAALYRTVADEEAQHALLAFRIVRFLGAERGEDLVAIALGAVFEPESRAPVEALGILGEEAQRTLHRAALASIVVPALAAASSLPSALQNERRPGFFE
ncbi:MAG: ferritin-like domain-containing protein [Polyangiales bacterium]